MERLEALASSYGNQRCLYPNCAAMVPLQIYQLHLNYCRRKWRGSVVQCPYNNTHRYGQPEEAFHQHVCPDKNAKAESRSENGEIFNETFTLKQANVVNRNSHHLKYHQHNLATVKCPADLFGSFYPSENGGTTAASDNGHIQEELNYGTFGAIKSAKALGIVLANEVDGSGENEQVAM